MMDSDNAGKHKVLKHRCIAAAWLVCQTVTVLGMQCTEVEVYCCSLSLESLRMQRSIYAP